MNLFIKLTSLVVFMVTQLYLLGMLITVQQIFNHYKRLKSNWGKIVFIVLFVLLVYFAGMLNRFIIEPILVVLINTSDY